MILYRNGLQRARFLPAIEAIKRYCDVMNVDAGIDYRLRTLTQAHLWLSPLNDASAQQMEKLYTALAGAKREGGPVLEINHRPLATLGMANQTLAVDFTTLCVDARSQHDYIALSRQFHTVMLFNVQVMTTLMESEARRFIALVDEFYERHVKLVVSAEAELFTIYQGKGLSLNSSAAFPGCRKCKVKSIYVALICLDDEYVISTTNCGRSLRSTSL
ncbi:AFG1-like ATPase [Cedecea neteri]|uniref:AFG1-like ATPase n=1 Tax=Cedecea neteri TaxID=158822 RepID=A0A2X2VB24_9ENTR|nr:AFG1-like ATPase [Cedecea neteri]